MLIRKANYDLFIKLITQIDKKYHETNLLSLIKSSLEMI